MVSERDPACLSEKRLSKIQNTFHKSLEGPLLELIPIVRERMPDYITATWLKQMGWIDCSLRHAQGVSRWCY
jgi:hypothetical protein